MAPPDTAAMAAAAAVLAAFFAPPNQFRRPGGTDGITLPEELIPPVSRYQRGHLDRPLLLPFRSAAAAPVVWYACANDDQAWRTLQAELDAFIGPSYARFDRPGHEILPGGERLQSFLERHNLRVVRFEGIRPAYDANILRRWRTYWSLLERQPARPALELRSFAHLRAAFDSALVAKNEKGARAAIAALRDSHGLTAENRAFLDIRLAAAFSRWDQIVDHPRFRDLMHVRLPPETYGDIWEALYEFHLKLYEAAGKADHLISTFVDEIKSLAGPLLKGRGRSRRPAVLKCFLLDALSQPQPAAGLCAELLGAIGEDCFGAASQEIRSRVHALQPRSGYAEALKEMEFEHYEQGFSLLWPESDSLEVLNALLRCAKEIADPARAIDVIRRVSGAPNTVAAQVRTARARLLSDVEMLALQQPPPTIPAQLAALPSTAEASPDVLGYWREIARAGDAGLLARDPRVVGELVAAMEDQALAETSSFESLYPVWFEWLVERSQPDSRLIDVYLGFIESLRVRDRYGESELELIRLATIHALRAGPSASQYEGLVDQLTDIFLTIRSATAVRWGLETVDALAAEPCRNEEARTRLLVPVMTAAVEFHARLDPAQLALSKFLAREAGYPMAEPAGEQAAGADVPKDLAVRVLLYSLDRQAIERAARTLRELFPNSRFDTNDDHVCTDRLKNQAKAANWIVFVANVAKHQAFHCIENERGNRSQVLYAEGTGTTRLVERVVIQSRSR